MEISVEINSGIRVTVPSNPDRVLRGQSYSPANEFINISIVLITEPVEARRIKGDNFIESFNSGVSAVLTRGEGVPTCIYGVGGLRLILM
jgi:hypothetical protein